MDVPRPRRERQRDAPDVGSELLHGATLHRLLPPGRTYVLSWSDARRVSAGALPQRPEPRQGDALRVVAQPVHGLRPPVHVLLRPALRAPGRPSLRRPLWPSLRVKSNIVEVLRRELARDSWQREEVVVGAATDPYQPAEGRFRLTRACLVALCEAWTPFSIITRGPLVVRDVDVLAEASSRGGANVSVSLPTLDERVWRTTEPGTAPPTSRLAAVRKLAEAGIDVGVAVAPVLPGLSDRPGAPRPGRARGPRRGGALHLGECREPASWGPRALPGGPRPRLAGAGRTLRGALRAPRVSAGRDGSGDHGAGARGCGRDESARETAAGEERAAAARARPLT